MLTLEKYINSFDDFATQENCRKAIEDLKAQGRTEEWILAIFGLKPRATWSKYGFGICFTDKQLQARADAAIAETTSEYDEWLKKEHVPGQTNGEALAIIKATLASLENPEILTMHVSNDPDPFDIYHNDKEQTRYTMTRNGLYDKHLDMMIDGILLCKGGYRDIDWCENLYGKYTNNRPSSELFILT